MNVGIIGAGTISASHINSLKAAGATVLAIADRRIEGAQARAEEHGIPRVYGSHTELLADKDIDAVTGATPVTTHGSIVVEALRAGKHVFCEKPPAMSADEVREMIAARDASGKVLQIGFVRRFNGRTIGVKRAADEGRLGRVLFGEATRLARISNPGGWFSDLRYTKGGTFFDAAIHEVDLLFYLMGYPRLASVRAFKGNDNADLHERARALKRGYVSASTGDFNNDVETSMTVIAITVDGVPLVLRATSATGTVDEGAHVKLTGANGGISYCGYRDPAVIVSLKDDAFETEAVAEEGAPFDRQMAHFVDCCENGTATIAPAEDALALMEFYDAAYRSAAEGREILL